jgi:hypothetical protein
MSIGSATVPPGFGFGLVFCVGSSPFFFGIFPPRLANE